jgi:lysozyme family protein
MKENFNKIIDEVLRSEGGYVDHPKDPGGATNMGITFATLQRWRGHPITKNDVKNLTREEVIRIYKAFYWNVVRADELPAGLDYAVFDFAVNSGPDRAVRYLQKIVGATVDGKMGPETLRKVAAYEHQRLLINRYLDDRVRYLQGLANFATFGKGWMSRVNRVRKTSNDLFDEAVIAGETTGSKGKKFNLAALIPLIVTIITAIFGATRK